MVRYRQYIREEIRSTVYKAIGAHNVCEDENLGARFTYASIPSIFFLPFLLFFYY